MNSQMAVSGDDFMKKKVHKRSYSSTSREENAGPFIYFWKKKVMQSGA